MKSCKFSYCNIGVNDIDEKLAPIDFIKELIEKAKSHIAFQGAITYLNEIPLMAFPSSDPQAILAYYQAQIQAKKSVVICSKQTFEFSGNNSKNFMLAVNAFYKEAKETGTSIEGFYEDKRLKEKFTFVVHPDLKAEEINKFYYQFLERLSNITSDYPSLNKQF